MYHIYIQLLCVVSTICGLKVLDLSHSLNENSLAWPTYRKFELIPRANHTEDQPFASNDIALAEHTSTHVDAPIHFSTKPGTYTAATMPIERLVGPLVLIDLKSEAEADRDYVVSASDITDWEDKYGKIPEGAVVLVEFGWAKYWPNFEMAYGSNSTNTSTFHFPGIGIQAARVLADRNIYGLGVDTPSPDVAQDSTFPLHYYLQERNVYLIENVGDMSQLPEAGKGVTVVVGSLKIDGGTGSPIRLIALIDEESDKNMALTGGYSAVLLLVAAIAHIYG